MKHDPGIEATAELSLRVSVATLARVVFQHPIHGEWTLALERRATLHETKVDVKAQPFGGAIRILDLDAVQNLTGDFHFDSERSRAEQDFRIFIRPADWPALREFCLQQFSREGGPILETDPGRELVEEFYDVLNLELKPDQYTCKSGDTIIENGASPTANVHARGSSTVRIYRVFETHITDTALTDIMLKNSAGLSDQSLSQLALQEAQTGGRGRASAILTLPLKRISDVYLGLSLSERGAPILFEEHRLDETVAAVLEGILIPKYQRL